MRNLYELIGAGPEQGEIIVDLFAGGGGASEGIRMAIGRDPDAAVNHNPMAVSMHAANHPDTEHFTEDVWAVSPTWVTQGRPVGLLWASPDCTHFSKAKGGAPVRNDRIRSLAMVLVDKWIPEVRPRVIIMENVEEMTTWGPLDCRGRIIEQAKGDTFRQFINRMRRQGYKVEWKELRACDYGAPTIRKRLFLIARCDGQPIIWPEQTHGDPKSEAVKAGELLPWRTAAECIDWSIPCPSIFDTAKEIKAKYGARANRPLAEKTLKRIAEGIRRYVLEADRPFVVNPTHGVHLEDVAEPFKTVTGANRGEKALVNPLIVGAGGREGQCPPMPVNRPLRTASTKADKWVVVPHLSEFANASATDEPLRTVTAGQPGFSLVSPLLEAHYAGQGSKAMRLPDIQEPLRTMSTENRFGVVGATLVGAGGPKYGGKPVDLAKPMGTLVGDNHRALAAAFLAKHFTGVVGAPMTAPVPTVTTVDHNAVVAAHIDRQFSMSKGNDVAAPLGATTAGGGGKSALIATNMALYCGQSVAQGMDDPARTVTGHERHGLVASNLVKMRGTNIGQPSDEPLATVSAGGTHYAEVRAFLTKYYSEGGQGQSAGDPMHTLTTRARMGLVTVQDQEYIITDIGMRMLHPRELFRAQGFPDSYIIGDDPAQGLVLTKTDQVRMCGNSVCPPMAAALVRGNVPELAVAELAHA